MTAPADNRPSLNDAQVVETILISLAREAIGCRIAAAKEIIREEDANTIEEKEVESRARIFLNRDKNYITNPEWHKPGAIDAFLAKALSLDVRGSEDIIKGALSQFVWDVREKLNIPLRPDISETEWKTEIKEVVQLYRELFQGIARSRISTSGQTQVWTKSAAETEAGKQEFLGDPTVVEKVLIALARESLNAHRAVVSGLITIQDAAFIEEKEIEARTRIFLGRDKAYAIDPNWNKPGVIDGFLGKELGITVRGTENIIKEAFGRFLIEVRQHFDVTEHPNFTEAEWKAEIHSDIVTFRDLFLGLKPQPVSPAAPSAPSILEFPPGMEPEIPTTIFERKDFKKSPAASPAPAPAPVQPPTPPAADAPAKTETIFITKPFLADPQVVETILSGLAREAINSRIALAKGLISDIDLNTILDKEIEKRARIFLGRDKAYAPDAGWNIPGALDTFLAKQLNLEPAPPENTVKASLWKFIKDATHKADVANHPETSEGEWQPKIQPVVTNYRNLLVGLPWIEEAAPVPPAPATPEPQAAPAAVWAAADATTATATSEPEAEKPLPPPPTPAKKKSSAKAEARPVTPAREPAPAADQSPKLEAAGVTEPSRGNRQKWLVAAVIIGVVVLVSFIIIPRRPAPGSAPKQDAPMAKVNPAEQLEKGLPRTYRMKDGRIVSRSLTGTSEKEIPFKGAEADSTTKEPRAFEFWYDLNDKSGYAKFLIATQPDPGFPAEYGAPEAWDLWFTDELGHEKFLHKSVFSARFSPDASKLVYVTSKATLCVTDLEGRILAQTERAYEPNWSSDGSIVVFERVHDGSRLYPPGALQLTRFFWESNHVDIVMDGRFDDVIPHYHPSGKWILFVSGSRSVGAAFWKVPAAGGEPKQLTNIQLAERENIFVPTPHKTTSWSQDGRWFLYDTKTGQYEETWGLEFSETGSFKRAVKLSDGLSPQWTGPSSFVCQKRAGEGYEMVQQALPSL